MRNLRISRQLLLQLTDPELERNIYIHPNPLAREIFWQRLEFLCRFLTRHQAAGSSVLDLGGGSGVFSRLASPLVRSFEIVDLDCRDAVAIRDHFSLPNVQISQCDIGEFQPAQPVDIVTAADVLEHFKDLLYPTTFIRRVLRPGGLLLISVPTENWIYDLGRVIVRKTKPADHYHPASHIIRFLTGHGFELLHSRSAPSFGIPIPLFKIAAFRYTQP